MEEARDLRVVAFGGGTGLPVLLHGLRDRVGHLTAVVTVADDGGSSGRLRQELGISPPGDVRNCLVALAGRQRLAEVFNYRFGAGDLADHAVGNIIIAALADMAGGFCEGVEQAARFLRIDGEVLPAALTPLTIVAHHADGSITTGESAAIKAGKRISFVRVEPADAKAPPGVVEAVRDADAVVLSAGSLFTSTIPSLLGAGVREALAEFSGPVIYAANIMTQPGETTGLSIPDHVRAIADHAGPIVTDVLFHSGELSEDLISRYAAEGAAPAEMDREELEKLGVRVRGSDLISSDTSAGVRHDPAKLTGEVCKTALVRR